MPVIVEGFRGQMPGLVPISPPARKVDLTALKAQAEEELAWLTAQGIPDIPVHIIDCSATHAGQMEFNEVWLFADVVANVRATLAHEVCHRVYNYGRALGQTGEYWSVRGGLVAPETEIFAEDGRLLFGSAEARRDRHSYYLKGAGDLGMGLSPESEEGRVAAASRERLRQIVLSWIPPGVPDTPEAEQEAPGPTKPGASRFVDVAGHWAEADILECAEAGILRGDPDGRFRPDDKVTRAELATVLVRLKREA